MRWTFPDRIRKIDWAERPEGRVEGALVATTWVCTEGGGAGCLGLNLAFGKDLTRISFFFKLFYCCSITVVCVYSPLLPPHPSQTHLPPLLPPGLGLVHVSFIVVPEKPSPFPPLSPPTSPLVTVRLFLISTFRISKQNFLPL